jgi:hypothetical protein
VLNERPTLYTVEKGSTVRHLIIEGDDPAAKTLSKLENGVRTDVATGTHYEMDEKAMALIKDMCQKEDFSWKNDDAPVWESKREIVALLKLMGHTSLHDARDITTPDIPLDRWQGCKDKNGDDYSYWYTGTTVVASPRVTAKHGISTVLSTNTQELMAQLAKIVKIRKALGPERTFLLD